MSEKKLCRCAWPTSMKSMINYCLHCQKLIPVADVDLSPMQVEARRRFEAVGIHWPKNGD